MPARGHPVAERSALLAIDQGTSGTKAVVFDLRGAVIARATVGLASSYPQPGFVEQSPDGIYQSVLEALRRCLIALREAGGDPRSIAACGISNQRETFLLWDDRGRPLAPAVVWQCKRSVAICERLRAEGLEDEVRARTGLIIDPYFSATKLLWLIENEPDVRRAVQAGARFGTVDSWILHRLTRGAVHATDLTNASRTLLFNLDTLSWDRSLLERWGLASLRLPEIRPSAFAYADSDFEGLLPRPVPVASMIGDSHAAAFGEGCIMPGTAKATLGTGSSILMDVGPRRAAQAGGMVSTICWSTAERVDHALEGIVVSCGATIQWMRDQLGLFAESGDTEAMAQAVSDSGGVHLVPAFSGLGAPWWKAGAKGAICGLTFASTRNHIVRAALESIPFQVADVIEAMSAGGSVPLASLAVDGGISANAFVMQLLADTLGRPVVNPGIGEVSALGAALLAGIGAGCYRGLDEIGALPRRERRFEPGPAAAAAREAHAAWRETVRKIL
jgi:glycerol kinase